MSDILMERQLEEIEAALDYFGAYPRHGGHRKQDLVKALDKFFTDDPDRWLGALLEGDLRLLSRLCKAGPDVQVDLIPSDYPMVTEDNGFDITINSYDAVTEVVDDEEVVDVEMYDLSGRRVKENDVTPGVYIVKYRTKKGGITVKKILKR